MKEITSKELKERIANSRDTLELVDVREPQEFAEIRLKSSKNLPLSRLSADTDEIDWSKNVVFICRSWTRSGRVVSAFEELWKPSSNLFWGVAALAESCPELLESGS